MAGNLGALWGSFGVIAILVYAIWRITPHAWQAIEAGMNIWQWLLLIVNVVFMAWSEGYRGFQTRFSPRVAARTLHLQRNPGIVTGLLAPLFVIGYFQANRRSLWQAWIGTLAIVVLVLLVHQLQQPWRGILDAGVVVGLTWGVASFLVSLQRTFATGEYERDPGLPDGPQTLGAGRADVGQGAGSASAGPV
jgi:hypothetical protein